jgi:drug/metabolite transporter (DMT)-like permease
MNLRKPDSLYILLVIVFWASTAAVGKLLLQELSNMQLLFYICIFAAFSMFLVIVLQHKLTMLTRYSFKDFVNFFVMGFLGVFLYTFCLFEAINYLSAHEAFILNYLWPILVVVFSAIIFKETFTTRKLLGILFSFGGVLVLFTKGNVQTITLNNLTGTIYALIGAIAYALYSVLGKHQEYDKYASTMFNYLFAAFFTLPFLVFNFPLPSLTILHWGALLWLGIFANGFAFVFWFQALRHGDTSHVTNMVYFTPFLSLVFSYFILGEEILITSYVGLFLIVFGILIQLFKS